MFQQRRILDELNRFLLIAGLSAAAISMFFAFGTVPRYAFTAVMAACVIFAAIRIFSPNADRRHQENLRYLTAQTAVLGFFRRVGAFFRNLFAKKERQPKAQKEPKPHRARRAHRNPSWSELKQYKYFLCPQCAQRLRVPRGKGRIRVTCTRCGNIFETKS